MLWMERRQDLEAPRQAGVRMSAGSSGSVSLRGMWKKPLDPVAVVEQDGVPQ